jgi:hypothetical protein
VDFACHACCILFEVKKKNHNLISEQFQKSYGTLISPRSMQSSRNWTNDTSVDESCCGVDPKSRTGTSQSTYHRSKKMRGVKVCQFEAS